MTEDRERDASEAVDRLIESRRGGEAAASSPEPPAEANDLARVATTLEDQWRQRPLPVDEDAIWQRVNVGMRATPQTRPRRWSRFPSTLASLSLPAALPAWLAGRTPAVVTGVLAVVLVVVATFATQRQSADATFVTDVERLAQFTAAVLNDQQLSVRERGEVERRASGLLSAVQANPSVLADLDRSDAELVVSRIDGILTLLEPYEDDRHGGVETSVIPLATVREQVETSRTGDEPPRDAFTAATATATPTSTPTPTSAAAAETSTPAGRSTATPRRIPDPMRTPRAEATPETRLAPGATPPLERDPLRALCGDEGGGARGRCRAAMAQLESACDRESRSERCEEAVEDALRACRELRSDDASVSCERALLALTAALASDDASRRGDDDNRGNREDSDEDGNDGNGGSRDRGSDEDDEDDRGRDGAGRDDAEREGDDDRDNDNRGSENEDSDDDSDDDDDDDDDNDRADRGRWFGRGRGGGDGR